MDFRELFTQDERMLWRLVLADLLAPRGSTSPLTPPWKRRHDKGRRLLAATRRKAIRRRHG